MDTALRSENRYVLKAQGLKRCHRCRAVHALADFDVEKTKAGTVVYRRSLCRLCQHARHAVLRERRRADPAWYCRSLVPQLRHRAAGAGLPFDLTAGDLYRLWVAQAGCCYYTGLPLDFQTHTPDRRSAHRATPSLDRLNPIDGYVAGNVVWTSCIVNRMKSDLPEALFLAFCHTIAERFPK